MSIQHFQTSNGSGLYFSLQQIILSLVLSLALCDFLVKAGIFFVNNFFFSEIQLCANRHCSEGMVSGFLLSSILYQTQARSRTLICALGKMCSPYLLRFFSLSTKDKASCLLLVVVSLLHLLPHKFISRLSRVWDSEMVTCVPCHRGVAPFHPQKMYGGVWCPYSNEPETKICTAHDLNQPFCSVVHCKISHTSWMGVTAANWVRSTWVCLCYGARYRIWHNPTIMPSSQIHGSY